MMPFLHWRITGIELKYLAIPGVGVDCSFFHSEELKEVELFQVLIPWNQVEMKLRHSFCNTAPQYPALSMLML